MAFDAAVEMTNKGIAKSTLTGDLNGSWRRRQGGRGEGCG